MAYVELDGISITSVVELDNSRPVFLGDWKTSSRATRLTVAASVPNRAGHVLMQAVQVEIDVTP